jgi:hypothetical protein
LGHGVVAIYFGLYWIINTLGKIYHTLENIHTVGERDETNKEIDRDIDYTDGIFTYRSVSHYYSEPVYVSAIQNK